MKRTLFAFELLRLGTGRAAWKLLFRHIGNSLEVIVAGIAEVCRSKTEEHCHRTAVATLVLEEVCSVFGAHLRPRDVGAGTTNQLCGIIIVDRTGLYITPHFAAIVCLFALETDIVGISLHGKASRVAVEAGPGSGDGLRSVQSFIFQPHECFALDVFKQSADRFQKIPQDGVFHWCLADGAQRKAEGNTGSRPTPREDSLAAVVVEHMAARQLNGWSTRKCL